MLLLMHILVCVKQVIDPESPLTIGENGRSIQDKDVSCRMNRYDEYALEEALLIRESRGGRVDAVTVGPPRCRGVLTKCIEKGADEAIHVSTPDEYLSPDCTAFLIASCARGCGYDLILTGAMSEDFMRCQTGPMLASLLDIPCATAVVREQLDESCRTILAECEIEGGLIETMRLNLPALLTIQTGINRPRYPSLSNVRRAKTYEPRIVTATINDPSELLVSLSYPQRIGKGTVLEGTPKVKAQRLLSLLHERALV